MSEVKQVKDDDSVELGTVLQLAPHTPTNKVDSITRGKDGEEYISLDDVYSTTGQESFQQVVDNCRAYIKNKRLHRSGFEALRISGVEGLVPGYDRLNAIRGGESFIDSLKKGFVTIIKAVKRFCLAVIDWIILRIRTLLGFEKTEKELAIVAEYSDSVKAKIGKLLALMANEDGVSLDVNELFSGLPDNVSNQDAFTIIQHKNRNALEQSQALVGLTKDLDKAEEIILAAGQRARSSASRYQMATRKLEQAFKNKDTFNESDILEYRHALDREILEELDAKPLTDMVSDIVSKAWGIDLGDIGIESNFKASMEKNREAIQATVKVRLNEEFYEEYRKISSQLSRVLMSASKRRYDANQLANLKSLIEVKDAELIQAIDAFAPGSGILTATYSTYSGLITRYISQLEYLVTLVSQIRRSIAGIVNWSNKVDKLMLAYISRDIKNILETESEVLPPAGIDAVRAEDSGERKRSTLDIDYDALFINKHPKLSGILEAWRGQTMNFRKKNIGIINTINEELKKIGITRGI